VARVIGDRLQPSRCRRAWRGIGSRRSRPTPPARSGSARLIEAAPLVWRTVEPLKRSVAGSRAA
jgi:hypothetical protein